MTTRTQFSVKISGEMEEMIEEYAQETHRSKSNALVHLMWVGATSDEYVKDVDYGSPGVDTPISVSTEFTDVVDEVEQLADEKFDGTFSRAVRWAVDNGRSVENVEG